MSSFPASSFTLPLDSPDAALERVGGKGASLARMVAAGLPVPPGFHVTTEAYRRFVEENHLRDGILAAVAQAQANDPATLERASEQIQSLFAQGTMPVEIAGAIRQRYRELGADLAVAVRSSATAEDLPDASFAGQLETYLNVRGPDAVLDAVKRCWASLWTGRAIGYRQRQGIRPEDVSIAVVVQRLVAAQAAGVAFTANPVTGARDELMINAAWGLGEAVVSSQVTPDTIVVNKQTGAIASREIASKEVMTVRLETGTREEPVPAGRRRQAALEPAQVAELARLGVQIEQLYGQPMDIEWAMCDGRIFIVQARPITALPEARAAFEWKVPQAGARYFRQSVAELLPEPLSPLFATLALPVWSEATQQIMAQTMDLQGDSIALLTVHGYVYYEMRLTAWQTARLLFTMIVRWRRLVRMLRTAPAQWADEARPHYANATSVWTGRDLAATPSPELLAGAHRIVEAAASYYVSVQLVLGVVNLSEAAFTNAYNHLIKRKSDPPALTFLLGFDSTPIRAEKSLYDLAMWARGQAGLTNYLARASSKEIAAAYEAQASPIADGESWREFSASLAEHLNRFGHAVYDLDFAKTLPAEAPASLLETLKYFIAGQGRSPYERQAAAVAAREQAAASQLARLRGLRLRLFRSVLGWAQRVAPMREDALASVGLGWPVLRRILRELGRRMAAAGAIAEPDEVFWLKWDEVEAAARSLDDGQPAGDYHRAIAERRQTWQRELSVMPPVVLPVKGGARFFGLDLSRWMPARSSQAAGNIMKGIGASPGRVTGPACVIHGPEEFDQMKPGDILVAKITTPAWTPLFALASGIVTDVGGPLSHSSIVAREYGVPAVLGTGVATDRIHSGQRITVDGDSGVVTLDE
ncbi:MAG TPA: PEP/pyruvate-binding domain-containing protein [Terracidiphilus sp.]|nr:PEP/pyruvate-binding domain-containing protein [Terracidiphilus sp.]